MRILMVGGMYPPHYLGGYEVVWRGFVHHMREQGHEVRVVCSDLCVPGVPADAPEDPDVHRDLRWYVHGHSAELGRRGLLRRERHNARAFDRHVADLEPDVVMWWHMLGLSLGLIERARGLSVPTLAVVHDEWPLYGLDHDGWSTVWRRHPWQGRLVARAARLPLPTGLLRSGAWTFNSRWMRERVLTETGPPAGGDATVVPPGIRSDLFPPAPPRPWAGRLAYVGRIDDRKGIDVAIEALRHLPDATLTVTGSGDGSHLENLRTLAASRDVASRVTFASAVPRDRLAGVYAEADAVVFAVTWNEPWGLVPLEAMAVGRPVIATGTGGSGEYLRDGENALLVPVRDEEAIASAVRRLADDPELRDRLREGGFVTAAAWREERFLEGLEEELLRVAGRSG